MKLIDLQIYGDNNVPGWGIDILKFRRRSVIEVTVDKAEYQSFPSILIQLGPTDLLYVSLGLFRYILSISLWARHYGD